MIMLQFVINADKYYIEKNTIKQNKNRISKENIKKI